MSSAPADPTTTTAWTVGTVVELRRPAPHLVVLRLEVADRPRHWPGQHYLLRLRAEDGYTAQRSYSLASDDGDPLLELCVERLPDGEVSEFLAEAAAVGDQLELRGPIGRWFRWDLRTPAVAVVGGTGVVPAVAMLRAAARQGRPDLLRVVAVGRDPVALPYAGELAEAGAVVALTRADRPGRPAGPPTVAEVADAASGAEVAFVCGSSRFVELATRLLREAGTPVETIRVEQFGVTG